MAIEAGEELAGGERKRKRRKVLARFGIVVVEIVREGGEHVLAVGEERNLRAELAGENIRVDLL